MSRKCDRVMDAAELWAQRLRVVGQRVVKGGNNAWRRVRRGVKRFLFLPLLRIANKVLTAVAGALPQDARARIDSSGLLRAGFVEWLGLTSFANRYMPALSTLSQKMARWFLSRFDEGQVCLLLCVCVCVRVRAVVLAVSEGTCVSICGRSLRDRVRHVLGQEGQYAARRQEEHACLITCDSPWALKRCLCLVVPLPYVFPTSPFLSLASPAVTGRGREEERRSQGEVKHV